MKILGQVPAIARRIARWWLPQRERGRKRALEAAFNEVKSQAIRSEHGRFEASKTIFNIALFFLIAERDIQCLKIDALTHGDEWTRKLCARIILLTIHEFDLDKVSGQALRNALDSVAASQELRNEIAGALREVRLAQQKARKEFSFVRNAAIAHRDADALKQYRAIRNIQIETVFAIAVDFYSAAGKFIDVVPRLMLESSTLPSLLKQYLDNEKKTHDNPL